MQPHDRDHSVSIASVSTEVRRYHVLSAIGRGGFGTVYKAELLGPGGFTKTVALKVLNASVEDTEGVAERLRDEARMLGLLRHRSIVRVDGLHLLNGRWTVVMEYIEGVDLKRVLSAGPAPVGVALEIIEEISSALYSAWDRPQDGGRALRLMHRDIKPSNIQLTAGGEVRVLDFGVARAEFQNREAQTRSLYFGSLEYMAPERMDQLDTHKGDVYSLGAVLYELLTGLQLGRTSANEGRHLAHLETQMARLWALHPDEELFHIVADCLAFDPDQRPDARVLERRAHRLRQRYPEPWLRDWAETRVPHLVARQAHIDDELSGSILVEEAGVQGNVPDSVSAPVPPQSASGSISRARPRSRSPVWLGMGMVVALSAVGVLGVGLIGLAWWAGRPETDAVGSDAAAAAAVVATDPDAAAPSAAAAPADAAVVPAPDPLASAEAVELLAGADSPTSVFGAELPTRSDASSGTATTGGAASSGTTAPARAAAPSAAGSSPTTAAGASASKPASSGGSAGASTATAAASGSAGSAPSTSTTAGSAPSTSATAGSAPSTSATAASASSGGASTPATTAPTDGPTGKVLVSGDALSIRLVGGGGRYAPGAVPAGSYTVMAAFEGDTLVEAGSITVVAGKVVNLSCRAGLARCVVR